MIYKTNSPKSNGGLKILKSENLKILLFYVFSLSLVVSYAYRYFYPLEEEVNYQQLTLTNAKGILKLPNFSPDGKYVVYAQRKEGVLSDSIVMIDPNYLTKKLLIKEAGNILDLTWSPNSKSIVYSQWKSIHNRKCKISIINLDDDYNVVSNRELLECSDGSRVRLAWGTKNERIYFNERESFGELSSIFSYSLATNLKTQLALPAQIENQKRDYFIVGNSSGSHLAVIRFQSSNKTELSVFETEEDEVISTGHVLENIDSVTWFGGEQKLLLSSADQLKIYDYQKDHFEILAPRPSHSESFHVSESTNSLAYSSHQSNLHILSYDLPQNTEQVQPNLAKITSINISKQTSNEYMPSFANKSNTMAYLSDASGKSQIWLREQNGEIRQVSDSPVSLGLSPLKWSPDDLSILFQHQDEIFKLIIKTQKLERLIDSSHMPFIASWARSNNAIFYSSEKSGDWQIWRYDFSTDQHRQITSQGGYSANQHVSGDLYVSRLHEQGLWRLSIQDRYEKAEKIIDGFDAINYSSWKLKGDDIYYLSLTDDYVGIVGYNISNKSKQKVFNLDSQMKPYFAINENQLLITRTENSQSSIELLTY